MGVFIFIIALIIYGVIWSLPVWFCCNLIIWIFNLSYHVTILQACAISIVLSIIHALYFNKEDKK